MLRWTKWVTPMAALVLMAAFQPGQARGDDAATAPAGKATVTVTVVDGDGKPVPDAKVAISNAPGKKAKGGDATSQPDSAAGGKKARPVPIAAGTTGADGTVALTKIPDGDFIVTARIKGSAGRGKVTIVDDKDGTVTVTLMARPAK